MLIAGDFNSHGKVEELERAGFAWLTRDLGDTTRLRLLGIPITGLSYDHFVARRAWGSLPASRRSASSRTTTTRAITCRSGRCSCQTNPCLAETRAAPGACRGTRNSVQTALAGTRGLTQLLTAA